MPNVLKSTIHDCQIRSAAGAHGKFLGIIPGQAKIIVTVNEPDSPHDGFVKIVGTLPPVNEKGSEDLTFLKSGGIPFVELANLIDAPQESSDPIGQEYDLYFNGGLLGTVKLVPK